MGSLAHDYRADGLKPRRLVMSLRKHNSIEVIELDSSQGSRTFPYRQPYSVHDRVAVMVLRFASDSEPSQSRRRQR
jgi:hypothetical protein